MKQYILLLVTTGAVLAITRVHTATKWVTPFPRGGRHVQNQRVSVRRAVSKFVARRGLVTAREIRSGTRHVTLSAGIQFASCGSHHSAHEVGHNGKAQAWPAVSHPIRQGW